MVQWWLRYTLVRQEEPARVLRVLRVLEVEALPSSGTVMVVMAQMSTVMIHWRSHDGSCDGTVGVLFDNNWVWLWLLTEEHKTDDDNDPPTNDKPPLDVEIDVLCINLEERGGTGEGMVRGHRWCRDGIVTILAIVIVIQAVVDSPAGGWNRHAGLGLGGGRRMRQINTYIDHN